MSLESWQYIEKIPRDSYFAGYIKFKLRGELNQFVSEKEQTDYFHKLEFYDIEIKVEEDETDFGFTLQEIKDQFQKYQQLTINADGIVLNYKSEKFTCYPIEIRLLESTNSLIRKHTMVEGSEVHSYFETKACIVLRDYTDETFCKDGYPTGREETELRENVEFKRCEYFTKSCEKKWGNWIQVGKSCIPGLLTGKRENNLEQCQYREEFYNFDCSTYWGDWQKIENIKGTPTGKTKRENGFLWAEYYGDNCKTNWIKQHEPTVIFEGCIPGLFGCLANLIYVILFLLLFLPALGAVFYNFSFWLIPLLVILLIYLFGKSTILETFFISIFKWFGYLFVLALIGLIFYSIYSLFTNDFVKTEWSVPDSDENDESIISYDTLNNEISDSLIYHTRSWYDYESNYYEGSYSIRYSDVSNSEKNIEDIDLYSTFGFIYKNVSNFDSELLPKLYLMLDSIKIANSLNEKAFAEVIVSFVQDIDYVFILDIACDSKDLPQEYADMIRMGTDCEGNVPFGLRTPVQFMADLAGDCDTRTVLVYTILKHFNYDVAIVNSDEYLHSMIGINLPYTGDYKLYNGKRYYLWETTNKNFTPGLLPQEVGNLNYWYIELN